MYLEAKIVDNGNTIDTFYDDVPSTEGLSVGSIITEERQYANGSKTTRKYKILSSEETTNPKTTQIDPSKRKPMLKIELELIII